MQGELQYYADLDRPEMDFFFLCGMHH